MTDPLTLQGRITVVDDQPPNLRLMEDMLGKAGHAVRSFPRGRMALNAAAGDPPDLILLDINMPEMNGFEVCRQLKQDRKLAHIPVIFLSALSDVEDKVAGFRCGGADYITKPFDVEEVHARVGTQLQLQHARQAERSLLEHTLTGAVKMLTELIHQTEPSLTARSNAILRLVQHMVTRLALEESWQYDLAASLCLTGCVALPPLAFERVYGGEVASAAEVEMYRAHPELTARLLSNIPRLEGVAAMIRGQFTDGVELPPDDPVTLGARLLRVAVDADRRQFRGKPFSEALRHLKATSGKYCRELLNALDDYQPAATEGEIRSCRVNDLRPLMILDDDLLTSDGAMILQRGATLNLALLERVRNFAATRGARQPIRVRVMRVA